MLLSHFREDFARLSAGLSPYTEVNANGLVVTPWGIEADWDQSDIESELETAREEIKALEEGVKDAEKAQAEAEEERDKLTEEIDTLRAEMDALRDPSEDGATVLTYRERAERAEAETAKQREYVRNADQRVREMQRELTALRKRKGIEPGLMAHARDVWELLARLSRSDQYTYNSTADERLRRYREDAQRLLDCIRESGGDKRAA